MRVLLAACSVGLAVFVAAAPAAAKFKMTLALGDSSPAVGQPVTVVWNTEGVLPAAPAMKLVAVAPGAAIYPVLSVLTIGPGTYPASDARGSFAIRLVRVSPHRWRASVTFPKAGSWRVVVPNWGPDGYAMPPPLVRALKVSPA
jgi:hypothetical protein